MLIFLFIGSIIVCTYIYKIYNCFDHDKDIDFQEIPNFLSKDECNELITYFEQHKENHSQSTVDNGFLKDTGYLSLKKRQSIQCWLSTQKYSFVKIIQRRLQPYIKLPILDYLHESLQLVKYTPGGFFIPHYDEKKSLFLHRYYRYSTLLIYLNDDYQGGETVFPRLNKTIIPQQGKAIYFKNINESNKHLLWYSLHGGNKVINGNKYIANVWTQLRFPNRQIS